MTGRTLMNDGKQLISQKYMECFSELTILTNSFHSHKLTMHKQELTFTEVGAGVYFPNDLSFLRAIDATVFVVQKVLRQSLTWEREIQSMKLHCCSMPPEIFE